MRSSIFNGVNMIDVFLSKTDLIRAKEIASQRSRPKEGYSSTNRWQADGKYHLHGLLGEMAYAKHYCVPFDDTLSPYGDDGKDLVILGKTVDVKTSNYDPPILRVTKPSEFTADLMALAWRKSDEHIVLCGFTTPQNMNANYTVRDFGHGNRMCLSMEFLSF